jgi:SWI/SNF-related matrix-associated actin-dependent regulator of chromatin subfamily A3
MVGPGEEVSLRREPQNKYDRNAIQVMNISGMQIGHIPRNVAGKLVSVHPHPLFEITHVMQQAPLMDKKVVGVEGIVHDGNRKSYLYLYFTLV